MGDELPLDPTSRAAAMLRIIDDIDAQDDEQREALLSAFLSAAWGSMCAFEQ